MKLFYTNGRLRFGLALLLALVVVYAALEWKSLTAQVDPFAESDYQHEDLPEEIPPIFLPSTVERPPQQKKARSDSYNTEPRIEFEPMDPAEFFPDAGPELDINTIILPDLPPDDEVYNLGPSIERWPVFPGCEQEADLQACFQEKLTRHIRRNLRIRGEYGTAGQDARVSIRFEIDKNGRITAIQGQSPDPGLTREVEEVFRLLPDMKPAMQGGREARVYYIMPVRVRL